MRDRRKLTPEQIEDQQRGSTRLGPGVWVDRHGAMHVSVPELLAEFHLDDTPENRERVIRTVYEVFRQQAPEAKIVEQE